MTDQISEQEQELRIAYINQVRELALAGHDVEVDPDIAMEMGACLDDETCDQDEIDSIHDGEPCYMPEDKL